MKLKFSIISFRSNPASGEIITAGMIASDGKSIRWAFSPEKFDLISLMDKSGFQSFKEAILTYSQIFEGWANPDLRSKKETFDDFFSFLSRYENQVIHFTFPKQTDLEYNDDSFSQLFKRMIGKNVKKESILAA
jgi:hypothetical protein